MGPFGIGWARMSRLVTLETAFTHFLTVVARSGVPPVITSAKPADNGNVFAALSWTRVHCRWAGVARFEIQLIMVRWNRMNRSRLREGKSLRILLSLIFGAWFFAAPPLAAAQFKSWVMAKLPDTPEGART